MLNPPSPLGFPPLLRGETHTLQVNLGYKCNQSCRHCHVDAGPWRQEQMDPETLALVPFVLSARNFHTLDLTGGAPELHPQFRQLVREVRKLNVEVIDRCNLTILLEPGQQDLADFLAEHSVAIIASLPCVEAKTVDRQRGAGVFERSLKALKRLNSLGYGQAGSGLDLHLVYNPQGPNLPPDQEKLEALFHETLDRDYGVVFSTLKVLTNMPIQRFAEQLKRDGTLESYKALLLANHSPDNMDYVMCRSLISVDWQGRLYDCDFNQMLGLPSLVGTHIRDLLQAPPAETSITVGEHCYGCTAGRGSSCGGALR